ncbi:MAG: hypothetical protein Q9217_001410 [Psora testacea]
MGEPGYIPPTPKEKSKDDQGKKSSRDEEYDNFLNMNQKALAAIHLTCSPGPYAHIKQARDAWAKLKQLFRADTYATKEAAYLALYDLRSDQFKDLHPISADYQAAIFKRGLPEHMKEFIFTLYEIYLTKKESIDLDYVTTALVNNEKSTKNKDSKAYAGNFGKQSKKKGSKSRNQSRSNMLKCDYCGASHAKKDCFHLHPEKAPKYFKVKTKEELDERHNHYPSTIKKARRHNRLTKTATSSSHPGLLRRKPSNDAIRKQHQRAAQQTAIPPHLISRLVSCLDTNNAASVGIGPRQTGKVNSDSADFGRAAKDNRNPLLFIPNLHNPCFYTISYLSDHGSEIDPLSPFQAYMLSTTPQSSIKSSASHHTSTTSGPKPDTASMVKVSQSNRAITSHGTFSQNAQERPRVSSNHNITTTTQLEKTMGDLADRFGAISLHDSPKTDVEHINEGNWPWAPRETFSIDVSRARYEANLLALLKDFALKARHEYALTKKWPRDETEKNALKLEQRAQRLFARGVREREKCDEDNYLEELDWYWRYWGREERAYQRVWEYVVRGDVGRKGAVYSAGMTKLSLGQKEWQKGVEF